VRPSVVLLGFVLGSSAAISFSLGGVALVFAILRSDYPRLDSELGPLLTHLAIFLVLTAVAGLSFWGALHQARWRWAGFAGLAVMLVAIGAFYWPD